MKIIPEIMINLTEDEKKKFRERMDYLEENESAFFSVTVLNDEIWATTKKEIEVLLKEQIINDALKRK